MTATIKKLYKASELLEEAMGEIENSPLIEINEYEKLSRTIGMVDDFLNGIKELMK